MSRAEDGLLYIQRMIDDERVRLSRAAGGIKGGNPQLVNREVNLSSNLEGYPNSRTRTRAESECVSVSGFVVLPRKESAERKPDASMRFQEFWSPYPLKDESENLVAGVWLGLVTVDIEQAVLDCEARYLQSDQVVRGVVKKASNWLHDCSRAGWKCEWPPAPKPNGKMTEADVKAAIMELRRKEGKC
jgi:hypothetical protein